MIAMINTVAKSSKKIISRLLLLQKFIIIENIYLLKIYKRPRYKILNGVRTIVLTIAFRQIIVMIKLI